MTTAWLDRMQEYAPAQDALLRRHPDWRGGMCRVCELPSIVTGGGEDHPMCTEDAALDAERATVQVMQERIHNDPRWKLRDGEESFR